MGRVRKIAATALLCTAGCTSTPEADAPANEVSPFSGSWGVEWCNPARPDHDCGGFYVNLVQSADRVCGDYGGALVHLRQVDEGLVEGAVQADTAVLDVQSGRNGEVVRIYAKRVGDDLHWKAGETLHAAGSDIMIIATDEVLGRREDKPVSLEGACDRAG
jgi:hypothetical protein